MTMNKDTFKLILFTIGLIIFVAMLFSGSFISSNVIVPDEFETVTGQDLPQVEPNYGDITDELKSIVDKAIGNLLNTPDLNLSPKQVSVVGVTEETYGNTALGCEQEGMAYSEVITPGYKVILEANGKTYDYRLDQAEQIVLCEKSTQ